MECGALWGGRANRKAGPGPMTATKHAGKIPTVVGRASQLPGQRLCLIFHALSPGFPPPLPAAEGPTVRKGMLGIATLDFAAQGKPVEAGRVGAVLSLQHPLEGLQALLGSLGGPWTPAGAATHSEFRERRPWKASGAISAIWLLLRSLQ